MHDWLLGTLENGMWREDMMYWLFGIPHEMNEEEESFFAWPSSQAFIAQSLG
jgi:hypothetical protein